MRLHVNRKCTRSANYKSFSWNTLDRRRAAEVEQNATRAGNDSVITETTAASQRPALA